MASQLIVKGTKNTRKGPRVLLSQAVIAQQGEKRIVRGRVINGQTFVSTVYEQGGEIAVSTYHPLSCTLYVSKISIQCLEEWYRSEYGNTHLTDLERQAPLAILRLDNKNALFKVLFNQKAGRIENYTSWRMIMFTVLFFPLLFLLSFHSIVFYSILFNSILFYFILFYSIQFCSIQFCSISFFFFFSGSQQNTKSLIHFFLFFISSSGQWII